MIKINNNYYAKDTIKQISIIENTEESCIHYLQFSVYISLGDGIIREEVIKMDNNNAQSLGKMNTFFNGLLNELRQ